ncbi:MAG: S8 family serine peptidase [Actinobacteria bacterium]|nr:S8 family serine peptidase [Actinomycetota bacterium]
MTLLQQKKYSAFIKAFFILGFFIVNLAFAMSGKLDPALFWITKNPARVKTMQQGLQKTAGEPVVRTIVTFRGNAHDIQSAGAKLISVIGDVAVVDIPPSRLDAIANLPSVLYVEASHSDHAYLDKSIPAIRADDARQSFDVTGRGVLVGIIDSGIYWQHEDFRKPDGTTRIKCILDLSHPGPVHGGTVYSESEINDALNGIGFIDEKDVSGHGTHVAGIAAADGSDNSAFGTFAGVAPEAELVIVKATRDEKGSEFQTADQIIALSFIDSVATALGMPYVVNLSFGGHFGAHDGTTTVERVIDRLVGPGIPGKAIVTVCGNDREDNIHAGAQFSGSKTTAEITFEISEYTAQGGSDNDKVQLDGWYDGKEKVTVTLYSPSGKKIGPVNFGNYVDTKTAEGAVYIWNGFYENGKYLSPGVNPFNNSNEMFIQISDEQAYRPPAEGTWKLYLAGTGGKIDFWESTATMPFAFLQGNIETGKVSTPGTAYNSITAAAFVTKKFWNDIDGNHLTIDSAGQLKVGDIASFSSPGPTRDGRTKPEIAAPGQMIAASLSLDALPPEPASIFLSGSGEFPNAFIMPQELQALSGGTSMAAPHVAGVIALLFQKYPQATALQIRDMLTESAEVDRFTETIPNNDWGWGKLDAYAALNETPNVESPTDYRFLQAFPNPFITNTTIEFELPVTPTVDVTTIRIFNVLGQQVRELLSEVRSASKQKVFWDGRDNNGFPVSSGIYFIDFRSGNHHEVKKLAFLGGKK